MKSPAGRLLIVAALAAFFSFSCHLDYGGNVEAKELVVPDMIIDKAHFSVIRDSKLSMSIDAAHAEIFVTSGKRTLSDVSFTQFDDDGKESAHGSAGKAVQDVQSENVSFSGGIEVYIESEAATVNTTALDWDSNAKTLKGSPDDRVVLTKKNGTRLEGFGFFADLSGRLVELGGGVNGTLVNN